MDPAPRSRASSTFVAALALCVASLAFAATGPTKPGRVEVELVSDGVPRGAGQPMRIGLRMKMDRGWHTYWKNPGDAGLPTKLAWTAPKGWTVGDIEWPAPERIPVGPLASYGYEDEIVLPMLVFPPRDWNGQATRLEARAEWLVCKESCIPESAVVAFDASTSRSAPGARVASLFDAARARQPHAMKWTVAKATRPAGRLELRLQPTTRGQFFPDLEELIEPGDAPRVATDGADVVWSARLGTKGRQLAEGAPVRGVWVPANGTPLLVDAILAR